VTLSKCVYEDYNEIRIGISSPKTSGYKKDIFERLEEMGGKEITKNWHPVCLLQKTGAERSHSERTVGAPIGTGYQSIL
jgi:hypothetical protein